jgi:glycosyltransferase involved in cell wall biosynthesis
LPIKHVQNKRKLTCTIYQSTNEWHWLKIQIWVNEIYLGQIGTQNVGTFERTFDLPEIKENYLRLTFKVKTNLLLHAFVRCFKTSRKTKHKISLPRDTLLLRKLNIGETVLLDYASSKSRFCTDLLLENIRTPMQVFGFFKQSFGLAEACRCTTKALETTNIVLSRTQLPFKGKHSGEDFSFNAGSAPRVSKEYEFRLFHCNGNHLDIIKEKWGKEIFENSYSIGFWHWELPDFPDEFLSWFSNMNEIWVPSSFVRDAIAPKSPVPVQLFPLAIDDTLFLPPTSDRRMFGLPLEDFLYITSFDFYSSMERKNPIGAIKAFSALIKQGHTQIHLVVKTSNRHADPAAADNLDKALNQLPNEKFTLIENTLPRETMLCLLNSCDAFVSLHRSEGFGLHLAEAMAMGKTVIATNWSGNVDFMNERNSYPVDYDLVELIECHGPYAKGNHWAEPNLTHATTQMAIACEKINTKEKKEMLIMARETIREQFSRIIIGSRMYARLEAIERSRLIGQI